MTDRTDNETFDEKSARALIAKLEEEIKGLQQENDVLIIKDIQDKAGDKDESRTIIGESANKIITENANKYQLEKYMLEKFHKGKTLQISTGDISRDNARILFIEKMKCQLNGIKEQFAGNREVISTVDQINNLLDKLPKKLPKGKA